MDATTISSHNKVVIVGSKGVGKKFIVSKILGTTGTISHTTTIPQVQSYLWPIDTKYYSATVDFWTIQHGDLEMDSKEMALIGDHCQGLILVYNIHDDTSFEAIKKWSSFIEDVQPSVLICVGNSPQPPSAISTSSKDLHEKARNWAIDADSPLDYIEMPHVLVNAAQQSTTGSLYSASDAEENAVGVLRKPGSLLSDHEKSGDQQIVEALICNMWDSITRKPDPYARDGDNDADSEDHEETGPDQENRDPTNSSTTKPTVEDKPARNPLSGETSSNNPVAASNSGVTNVDKSAAAAFGIPEDLDLDDDLHRMLQMTLQIRQEAVSGNMSDEARRARAADTILALMKMAELNDADDDADNGGQEK